MFVQTFVGNGLDRSASKIYTVFYISIISLKWNGQDRSLQNLREYKNNYLNFMILPCIFL